MFDSTVIFVRNTNRYYWLRSLQFPSGASYTLEHRAMSSLTCYSLRLDMCSQLGHGLRCYLHEQQSNNPQWRARLLYTFDALVLRRHYKRRYCEHHIRALGTFRPTAREIFSSPTTQDCRKLWTHQHSYFILLPCNSRGTVVRSRCVLRSDLNARSTSPLLIIS